MPVEVEHPTVEVEPPTIELGGDRPTPTSPNLSRRIMAAPVQSQFVRGKTSTNGFNFTSLRVGLF